MTSEPEVPSQCRGWLTVYYVYLLLAATLCLMEVIGSQPWGTYGWSKLSLPAGPFFMALFNFGVYAFAANSLKRVGTRWVAYFHIGLNAVSALVGGLLVVGYATSLSVPTLTPWPLIIYLQHPVIYPVLPLVWTIYWVVSKRVKTVFPATGTSGVNPIWIRSRGLTDELKKWSTRAWVIAILIVAMTTLVPWAIYAYPVLVISFANPGGDRWPLIYFAYPLILLAAWTAAYLLLSRNKFRPAKIVAAIPFALFILSGFADLQTKVLVMQHGRFAVVSALNKEQELERKREEEYRALNPVRPFTEFFSNGQKSIEGTHDDDGNFYGLLTTWYKSGELFTERNYGGKEGTELISTIYWHKNGQKKRELRGNMLLEWGEGGQLIKEVTLDDDGEYQTGFDRWVNQDGDRGETRYLDGAEIGYTEWYANGQIGREKSGRILAPGLYESEKSWYRDGRKASETCRASIDSKKYEVRWFKNGNLNSPPYDGALECP